MGGDDVTDFYAAGSDDIICFDYSYDRTNSVLQQQIVNRVILQRQSIILKAMKMESRKALFGRAVPGDCEFKARTY